MARKTTTTTKRTTKSTGTNTAAKEAKDIVKAANAEAVEEVEDVAVDVLEDDVIEDIEPIEEVNEVKEVEPIKKAEPVRRVVESQPVTRPQQKNYDQHDLILCKNVSAGWLKMTGKSGIPYVWNATGDVCEVEYGDLWAKKTAKSEYLYKPYFVIEDEELLEQPRWKDLKDFYEAKVYGLDDVNAIINVPSSSIRKVLSELSDGMRTAVAVRAATMIENGTLDSLKKIKIIDEVCGTDLMSIIPD